MGQVLSSLGGQYGGGGQGGYGSQRYGGRGYGGNSGPNGGVNGPNGNWPGYYLGGGGALPGSGSTSPSQSSGGGGLMTDSVSAYSDPLGGQHPWGGQGQKDHAYVPTPNEKDPYGLPGGSSSPLGGGVEATPDPLGPMTMGNEGSPTVDPKSQPQNPMRRSKGWEMRS